MGAIVKFAIFLTPRNIRPLERAFIFRGTYYVFT